MNISPFGFGAVRHLLGYAARIALPCIVALALASCSNGGGGGSGTSNVRVFNGIYQSSAVTARYVVRPSNASPVAAVVVPTVTVTALLW